MTLVEELEHVEELEEDEVEVPELEVVDVEVLVVAGNDGGLYVPRDMQEYRAQAHQANGTITLSLFNEHSHEGNQTPQCSLLDLDLFHGDNKRINKLIKRVSY
jgi:hypothetical protein